MNADFNEHTGFEQLDWVGALREGLAESDQKIRTAALNDGWAVVNHRGRVICEAMRRFFEQMVREAPPRGNFAIHALGGTGRQEICPGSDVDVGILVENIEENEHFFRHASQQLRRLAPLVPGLRDVVKANAFLDLRDGKHFDLKSLAALLDGVLLVGDVAFDHRIRRVCHERAAELGIELIFAVNQDLQRFDQQYPQPPGDVGGFHVKNGKGGLRNFQMAMWLYSFERWIPSVQVYEIYGARQQYNLPIDNSIKRAARKNMAESLRPDAAFIKLMGASGSILPALKDWLDYGVLDKLLPGFRELANKLYQPGHRAATLTRASRALQRVQSLEYLSTLKISDTTLPEAYFVRQYQDLGESARCALRLALLTEEIPQTLYGTVENYAHSVARYTGECLSRVPGLSGPTLRTVEFLMLVKRELLEYSETSDQEQVLESWHQKIRESKSRDAADTIRALALFAYAAFDFHNPEGVLGYRLDPEQWKNVQNFTQNLLYHELGVVGQPFDANYFDELGRRIGELLPRRLLASHHVDNTLKQTYEGAEILDPRRAHRIIHALKEVVQTGYPKLELKRDDKYYRLTLYTWDFPGLFWRVAGILYEEGCSFRFTDLYSLPDPHGRATDGETVIPDERRLICDVLTFDVSKEVDESWEDNIKDHIVQRIVHPDEPIPDNTAEILKPVMEVLRPRLTDLGSGLVKFSCHSPATNKGTHYAISRLLSERAGANIESIARDGTHDWPIPRTNFYIRIQSDLQSVAKALRNDLGEVQIDAAGLP